MRTQQFGQMSPQQTYYAPATTNGTTDMLSSIMPLIILMMVMGMMMPMMRGITAQTD